MAVMVWQPVQIHMDIEIIAKAQAQGVAPRPPKAVRTRLMPRRVWRRARVGAPRRVEWGHDEVHEVESFKKELRRMRRHPPWARDARRDCHGESSDNNEDSDGDNDDHDDGAQKPIQTKCGQRAGDRIAPQHMEHDSDDAPSDFGSQSSPDYDLGAGDQLCQSLLQPVPPSGPKPLRLARRLSLMKK